MPTVHDPEANETRAMHELVDFGGKDVLEIGCGDGRMTLRYAERAASVLACDPVETEIATARARMPQSWSGRVIFRVADITTQQLPDAAFDVVLFARSI
jgi:ubiquinone/menaquinone biosynthesis C-methylase UbiE